MKAVVDTGSVLASKFAGFRFDDSCDSIWYLATGYDYGLIFDCLAPIFFGIIYMRCLLPSSIPVAVSRRN